MGTHSEGESLSSGSSGAARLEKERGFSVEVVVPLGSPPRLPLDGGPVVTSGPGPESSTHCLRPFPEGRSRLDP